MHHLTVRRGAVLLGSKPGPRFWLLWVDGDLPLCMPIACQSNPLQRWHYRLSEGDAPGVSGQALTVYADEARRLDTNRMIIVSNLSVSAIAALSRVIERAAASERIEQSVRV